MSRSRELAFAQALRRCIEPYTQKEAAARLGVSAQYLNDLLRGRRAPNRGVAARVVAAFGECEDYWLALAGLLPADIWDAACVADGEVVAHAIDEARRMINADRPLHC